MKNPASMLMPSSSNPMAGMILLLVGTLAITLGFTAKGKQIINVILGKTDNSTATKQSTTAGAPTVNNSNPGTYVGESAAANTGGRVTWD